VIINYVSKFLIPTD